MRLIPAVVVSIALLLQYSPVQSSDDATSVLAGIMARYRTLTNQTYLVADNIELKLDAIVPRDVSTPVPTLVYIHGGGWQGGSKEKAYLSVLPYLQDGFAVVTPVYRLTGQALAPAAVEDVRCVLRWVHQNAEARGFDTDRIVVSGSSAGGHLALMAGMTDSRDNFDTRCPQTFRGAYDGNQEMPVRAIINWYGPSDLVDSMDRTDPRPLGVKWIGGAPGAEQRAARVSPLNYVRPDTPPVLSIHGDMDKVVPYDHSVRLHRALDDQGIPNQLITIEGGKHGKFTRDELLHIFGEIRAFLNKHM